VNTYTKDITFYRELWERLSGTDFTAQKLAERVRVDGGIDIRDLSESDVLALIEGSFSGSWKSAAFSFSEMLDSYSVTGGIENPEQIVGWVFASFVVADAVRQGEIEWELHFNSLMDGFLSVRNKLETLEAIVIFQRVFGCN